jgi:hypothetical protein
MKKDEQKRYEIMGATCALSWTALHKVFINAIKSELKDSPSFKSLNKSDREFAEQFACKISLYAAELIVRRAGEAAESEEEKEVTACQ